MKKNEIIDYLKDKLVDNVEYLTESCFIDKEHKHLVSFVCALLSSQCRVVVSGEHFAKDVIDVTHEVISNGKK